MFLKTKTVSILLLAPPDVSTRALLSFGVMSVELVPIKSETNPEDASPDKIDMFPGS